METLTRPLLEWHTESRPHPGETLSGDKSGVITFPHGGFIYTLDALGHGEAAAAISETARQILDGVSSDWNLEEIFRLCHERLRGSRGIALCLAWLDSASSTMSWLSVGNIQAVHVQVDSNGLPNFESLIMRGGVIGDRLPELKTSTTRLRAGDMVIFASDGIGYGWHGEFRADISPQELSAALINRHRIPNDDAIVTVLRYHGDSPSGNE